MNIFVINSGSSSLKYQLLQLPEGNLLCSGLIDRIGLDNSSINHKVYKTEGEKIFKEVVEINDHAAGLAKVPASVLI